jgi:hypothetical protein
MMLRRLCSGDGVQELRILADVCEPVKIYKRNALSTVNALMPYTRFVDATRPDASVARNFNNAVEKLIDGGSIDQALMIQSLLIKWQSNNQNLELVLDQNPILHETKPLAKNLNIVSMLGLKALKYFLNNQQADAAWYDFAISVCNEAKKPYGEVELMIVDGVIKLIESTK